jgi:protein dithiol oxidoreductase (disulfide-forming)
MQRRQFSAGLASAALGPGFAVSSHAQGGPVEGTHYVRLSQPLAMPASGKFEVVEFFWYGCPHCHEFEPALEAWVKTLAADVIFRRAPVAFRPEPHGTHQRIYFALEAMGLVATIHRKVFYAVHNERARLDKPADISAFMAKNGVDGAKFLDVFNSFSVQTKARQAHQLSEAYKIDGVPALGIHGRFYTSGSLAGSNERALAVADHLLKRLRTGG